MPTELRTAEGQYVIVEDGESLDLEVTLKDAAGATIDAATVASLTVTLYDRVTASIINSRNDQDALNSNGHTITASILTVRLDPLDNVIVGTGAVGTVEYHVVKVKATYNDGTQVRTMQEEKVFGVLNIAAPT